MTVDDAVTATAPAEARPLNGWFCFAIGVAAGVVGLLPWIATGMRLPLQNLWHVSPMPEDMPLSLLPFSQYFIVSITALMIMGSALAGIASRATAARRPRFGALEVLGGVLLVQLVAAAQATFVVYGGTERSSRGALYLAVIGAGIVVSVLVGVLVLLLIAKAPRAGATIGLSLAALVASTWIGVFVAPALVVDGAALSAWLLPVLRWLPAVLVGLAIAWGGFRTPGRIAAAVVSLAALWIGPAFFTAVSAAAGSRVLASYPPEMIDYGLGVFGMAVTMPGLVLPSLGVALAIGLAGGLLLDMAAEAASGVRKRRELTPRA
jgi:hypothetical protein